MSSYRLLLPTVFLLVSLSAAASTDADADVKAGAVLYRDKGCAHCHGADTMGTKKAPGLSEVRNDKDWPTEKITDHILNGGQKMPPFRESLTDEEIAKLVVFLRAQNKPVLPPAPTEGEPASPPQ